MPSILHTKPINVSITQRDEEILALLEIIPLTARQVKKYSQTLSAPFGAVDTAHRRLSLLVKGKYLRKGSYNRAGDIGAEDYFQLSRRGWRHVYHDEAPAYPKRHAELIPPLRHDHTRALAEVLVHLALCAHRRGFRMDVLSAESEVLLRNAAGSTSLDGEVLFTQLADPSIRFHRYLELERSTRTLRSARYRAKTWETRAQALDAHQDERLRQKEEGSLPSAEARTRLLTFATESWDKVASIGRVFGEEMLSSDRGLYLGTYLPDFLNEEDGLFHPLFVDHLGQRVSALPAWAIDSQNQRQPLVGG